VDDLVAVAKIARPRGTRGEVVAELLTDFPDRFDDLENLTAVLPDGGKRDLIIEDHWFQTGRIVLKFAGVDSVDEAEKFRNAELCVGEDQAVELDEGEYFDWELEGCRVEDVSGRTIGTVREVMRTGGTEVLVVDGTKEFLIPFAEAICVEVDIDNKLIKVDPPEGLLEF